jgi:hypothetical protein
MVCVLFWWQLHFFSPPSSSSHTSHTVYRQPDQGPCALGEAEDGTHGLATQQQTQQSPATSTTTSFYWYAPAPL